MDAVFVWIERTAFSVWMRESLSVFAFPTILTLHTVGMAVLAGPSAAVDLRLLGCARRLPIAPLERLFPIMWAGFWLNAATGLALLVAYPAKALTNPLFYVKLTLITLALTTLVRLRREAFVPGTVDEELPTRQVRRLALASLLLWLATIAAGRWLAYTYTRLLAYTGLS